MDEGACFVQADVVDAVAARDVGGAFGEGGAGGGEEEEDGEGGLEGEVHGWLVGWLVSCLVGRGEG